MFHLEWVQTQVRAPGGSGYDGGHSFANFAGGGGEYINLDAMLGATNRGAGDSVFDLDGTWRSMLREDPSKIIPITVRKIFDYDGLVPSAFEGSHRPKLRR